MTEDDTNDNLTFTYSQTTLSCFSLNSTTGVANFTCTHENNAGNYTITIIARDNESLEDSGSVDYQILAVNDVANITTGTTLTAATYNRYYNTSINASDEESDAINWKANESFVNITNSTANSAIIQFMPAKSHVGTWNINITANDSRGANTSKVFTLVINDGNDPPVFGFVCDNNRTVPEEVLLRCHANGTDPDGNTFNFTANESFFNMSTNGTVSFIANDSNVGNYTINITITDNNSISNSTLLRFNVTNIIESPIIRTNLTNVTTYGWANFTLLINATDEDLNIVPSPELLTFQDNTTVFAINVTSGLITATFNTSLNGTHRINISVNDSNNQFTFVIMNLTIVANELPVIDAISNIVCIEGQRCNITITATDADSDTLQFYDNTSLFAINISTGNITFTPNFTDANLGSNYTFLITVNDTKNASTTALFRLNITDATNNTIPSITVLSPSNTSTVNVSENSSVRFLITTTDVDADSLETLWYVDQVLNRSGSDIEDFNYTPGFSAAGIRNITVNVSDGNVQNVSLSWTVNVTNVNLPVFLKKNVSNITVTETTTYEEELEDHFDDPDVYNKTLVNYTFFTVNQLDTFENQSEWAAFANDTVTFSANNTAAFVKQGNYSVKFALNNSDKGAGTVMKNYSSQNSNNSIYMRMQFYVDGINGICSGIVCNSSVSVLDVQLNLTNATSNLTYLSSIRTLKKSQLSEGWNLLNILHGNEDWTGIQGIIFTFYGNNTTNSADNLFFIDDLEFATNSTGSITVVINETTDVALITASRTTGAVSLFFVANDSDYTAESNEIFVTVGAASSELTATPLGAGGGGTNTEVASINIDAPEGVVGKTFSLLSIPLTIVNSGQVELKDISVQVASTIDGMKFSFDGETEFASLAAGSQKGLTLKVDIGNVIPQEYIIEVKGAATQPSVKDSAKIQVKVIDEKAEEQQRLQKKLVFMVDLFKENPECLELQDLLKTAEGELKVGNVANAERLMDSVIDSCRDLITSRAERVTKEKEEKFNWPLTIAGISVLSLVLLSYFSGKFTRLKPKRD